MPTLKELLEQRLEWQLSRREKRDTIVTQHEIHEVTHGDNVVTITFSRSVRKLFGQFPPTWSPIATAESITLPEEDEMELQPCGAYFGPNEAYALVPNTSAFWLTSEDWPSRT